MEALLQALLRLCECFEPTTSAELLALIGLLSLVTVFVIIMARAANAARQGMGQLAHGLGSLLTAIMRLTAALVIFWLTYCLARAALLHIQH